MFIVRKVWCLFMLLLNVFLIGVYSISHGILIDECCHRYSVFLCTLKRISQVTRVL